MRSPGSTRTPKTCPESNFVPDHVSVVVEPTPEEKREQFLLGVGGVTDLSHTFASMRVPRGFKPTLEAFKELAEGRAAWHMLMVYGPTGNGKSRCCEALVIALYNRGVRVVRQKWSDIIRFTLKAAMHPHKPDAMSYEDTFKMLRERRYLIIDDVGMGSTGGNWEWGELEDLVDYRLEKRLTTVITSNLDLKEIPPRIVSRFRDASRCRLICNEAPDQRPLEGK